MALRLTNFCDMAISHVFARLRGLDRFAALSHSAGLAGRCWHGREVPGQCDVPLRLEEERFARLIPEKTLLFESRRNGRASAIEPESASFAIPVE